MKRVLKIIRNENGSTTPLILGILFFGVMLIFLFFNFVKIFAFASIGNTAAEQASLAATDVVYDKAMDVIEEHWYVCGFDFDLEIDIICFLIDDYEAEKLRLSSGTENEKHRKAIDHVLKSKMSGDRLLRIKIRNALNRAASDIPTVVKRVIEENNADIKGSKIKLFNPENRVEVTAKKEIETMAGGLVPSIKDEIEQVGFGVKIGFLDQISWRNRTITLE